MRNASYASTPISTDVRKKYPNLGYSAMKLKVDVTLDILVPSIDLGSLAGL